MFIGKQSDLMALQGFIGDSTLHLLESSSIAAYTLDSMIHSNLLSLLVICRQVKHSQDLGNKKTSFSVLLTSCICDSYLQDSFFASFLLGWGVTNGAGLASYPFDTVRRRMMMTSGEAVKYKGSVDAFAQIIKNEGAKSLFRGAGANILRAIAGAGVLAGYDKLQLIYVGKKYGSGGG